MKFLRYQKDAVIAYAFDDAGSVGLRRPDGRGLLRTSDGIPRSVVDRLDVAAVSVILRCIVDDLDREACKERGVEVFR